MSEPRFGVWMPTAERKPGGGDGDVMRPVIGLTEMGQPREHVYVAIHNKWYLGGAESITPSHWTPMPPPPGSPSAVAPTPAIERPPHYAVMPIQPFDAARAWGLGLSLGSAVKYVARHLRKGDPIGDLKKAKACIDDEIAWLEKSGHGRTLG